MSIKFEIKRKFLHIILGLSLIILLKYQIISIIHLSIILIVGITTSIISKKYKIPIICHCLREFDRKTAKLPGQGVITFILGVFLLVIIFGNNNIVYASIMILTFGDSFAAIIGINLKKTKHLKRIKNPLSTEKVLEGTIVGIIFASLSSMIFVSIIEAVIASTVAMIIEGVEWKFNKKIIDDNVLIPLAAGFTIYFIRFFYLIHV